MASKIFGGANLGDLARSVKDRAEPSPLDRPNAAKPVLAAAELALTGRVAPALERENVFSVDPKRVRPWKYHNRTAAWYTRERCADLVESIAKDGQIEPVLARRITGDSKHEYELIYGMRRRFACEFLDRKLKLRVIEADDARAAVLMHAENADRQDITAMERGISFLQQLDAKIFATQESLAEAMGLSKGQVTKLIKAAGLLKIPSIGGLFADPSAVPVDQAYKLSAMMDRGGAKEVVLKAAQNLSAKPRKEARETIKALLKSLDRSSRFEPIQKNFNVGAAGRVVVTRNARGKLTLAFPQGFKGVDKAAVLAAVEQVWKELG
jgi:ParB family chromosome partitioning protein